MTRLEHVEMTVRHDRQLADLSEVLKWGAWGRGEGATDEITVTRAPSGRLCGFLTV